MKYKVFRSDVKKQQQVSPVQVYEELGTINIDVPVRTGEYFFEKRIVRINYTGNNEAEVYVEGNYIG